MRSGEPRPVDEFMSDQERRDWRGRFGDDDRPRRSDIVDLALHFHAESAKAVLLSDTGRREDAKWAAKSLIEGSGAGGVWSMPQWLAREKGWL